MSHVSLHIVRCLPLLSSISHLIPLLFILQCFNIIYNDITSTSSSSANANEATALAVGLRPPVAKRPIFK